MSATNRGEIRSENDYYPTPDWLIRPILPYVMPGGGVPVPEGGREFNILEPSCGSGAIVEELEAYPTRVPVCIDCLDIAPRGFDCRQADFLAEDPEPIFDLVITNPPYSAAQEFIDHSRKFLRSQDSVLCFLLRLNFLGSQKRASWWREHGPSGLYVTPRRPSFRKGGTDATEYAWFIWDGRPALPIEFLETELPKYR